MIGGLAEAALIIAKLNKGAGTNADKYPALKTQETNVEIWWNSLDWLGKVDVGGAAVHYHQMNTNYKWDCGSQDRRRKQTPYSDLKKSQKKIINWVFKEKDETFQRFYLTGMLGL